MIYVSAGHHSIKKGASFEGFYEYDEALVWVDLILAHLGSDGIKVPPGVLKDKVDFINDPRVKNKCAIEVHFNSAKDFNGHNVGRGSETLYFPGSEPSKSLATMIQRAVSVYFQPDRGIKEGWYKMNQENGPDFFLARTKCPAVIIEPEFIHRKIEIQTYRGVACRDIAEVLRKFLLLGSSEGSMYIRNPS